MRHLWCVTHFNEPWSAWNVGECPRKNVQYSSKRFFCKANYSRTFYISLPEIDSRIVSACTAASFINWCLLSLLWQVNWQSSICFLKVKHYTVWRWVETFRPFWTAWEAKTRCGDTSKEHEYSWLIIFTDSFYTLGR